MAKKAEFLSNKPLGEDLFDGQSQDKVAKALMQHIIDQASDLKNELVKLHGSSSNEEFKALIERLDILPKENSGDGSGEE